MSNELAVIKDTGEKKDRVLLITEHRNGDHKVFLKLTQGIGNNEDYPDEPGFIMLGREDATRISSILYQWSREVV